jgi:SSS family solute:Na+ symporter
MWYRRLRYLSLAEFFSERYNSKLMAGFYAVTQAIMFMIVAALGFTAMSKTIAAIAEKPVSEYSQVELVEHRLALEYQQLREADAGALTLEERDRLDELALKSPQLTFSYIDRTWLTIVLAIVILLYAVSGGLEAAFITDTIQGIFIILLSLMLIPFAIAEVTDLHGGNGLFGAFETFHQVLPEAFFKVLGSPNLPQFTWYYILAFGIMGVFNTGIQANQLTAAGSARSDEIARDGFLTGIFIKRYCTVIWGFIAMILIVLYGTEVHDPDLVWGMACRDLLPVGLVGLMVACLMAALMSTADALMLTSSSLLTNNVFRPLFPNCSEKTYILAGRLFCVFYIIGGVGIALALDDVLTLFILMFGFNAIIAAAFWLGMTWRRATRIAAWTSIIVTFLFTVLIPFIAPLFPGVRTADSLALMTEGYSVENTYQANHADVDERSAAITAWERLNERGEADGERPESLQVGDRILRLTYIEPRSIFWQTGLERTEDGTNVGGGMLKIELLALHRMGVDLTKNRYAFNETLGVLFRILVPFGLILLVSPFTRMEEKSRLDFFYARLRTPAAGSPEDDAAAVDAVRKQPSLRDDSKLFPGSHWEFRKWTKRDWMGQFYVFLAVLGLILILYAIVTLGRTAA